MNKLVVVIAIMSITYLSACGQVAPPAAPDEPQIDVGAIQTAAVQTVQAELAANAPDPTAVPPTAVPLTDTPPPAELGNVYAWNYIGTQESGGLQIEIARFLIGVKEEIPIDFTSNGTVNIFDDRPVMGEIIFKITNLTDKVITVHPGQGTVVAGGEQIELTEYLFISISTFGDNLGGEIYPGVTKIGGIWFGFKRASLDEITSATIVISAPNDGNYNILGSDFNFVLDLSNRQFDEYPEELR